MYFKHRDEIYTDHPSLRAVVLGVSGVRSLQLAQTLEDSLKARVTERLGAAAEADMPPIAAWREAFARMGLKPTQYRCAAEALLRRYRKDGEMPKFHPLIDYLNFVSMAYAIPIAAFDVDRIAEGIEVRKARGSETHVTFSGDTETPYEDEVVFADAEGIAHARRWTHRQGASSVVRTMTDNVLIVVEALHDTATEDLKTLGEEVRSALDEGGAKVSFVKMLGPQARSLSY